MNRVVISAVEREALHWYIRTSCPAKSGDPTGTPVQRMTSRDFYVNYKRDLDQITSEAARLAAEGHARAKADGVIGGGIGRNWRALELREKYRQWHLYIGRACIRSLGHEETVLRRIHDFIPLPSTIRFQPRARSVFDAMKKKLHVRHPRRYYGLFDCPYCLELRGCDITARNRIRTTQVTCSASALSLVFSPLLRFLSFVIIFLLYFFL